MARNSQPPQSNPRRKNHRASAASSNQQSNQHRTRATAICGTLSLITGAAVGAAVMYALDPESGDKRRHAAYDAAHGVYGAAHDAVSQAIGSAGHLASDAYHGVAAAHIPSRQQAMDAGQHLYDQASDAVATGRDRVRTHVGSWIDSARAMTPHRPELRRPTDISGTSAAALALGAIAAGLGAMWLFDPDRGRSRRAWIGQKTTRTVNETGSFMRATGRHLRNKSHGYAHDAQGYASDVADSISDSKLAEHVKAAIGQLGEVASSINVATIEGRVRLTGRMISDQVQRVLDLIREIPGVRAIDNQLDVDQSAPSQSNVSA